MHVSSDPTGSALNLRFQTEALIEPALPGEEGHEAAKPILMFETEETYFVQKPLPPGVHKFVRCKSSGTWKRAPCICGAECAASADHSRVR